MFHSNTNVQECAFAHLLGISRFALNNERSELNVELFFLYFGRGSLLIMNMDESKRLDSLKERIG